MTPETDWLYVIAGLIYTIIRRESERDMVRLEDCGVVLTVKKNCVMVQRDGQLLKAWQLSDHPNYCYHLAQAIYDGLHLYTRESRAVAR